MQARQDCEVIQYPINGISKYRKKPTRYFFRKIYTGLAGKKKYFQLKKRDKKRAVFAALFFYQ
jgi:hypothetical protein